MFDIELIEKIMEGTLKTKQGIILVF